MRPNRYLLVPGVLVHIHLLWASIQRTSSSCSHLPPERDDVIFNVNVEREARNRRSTEIIPLRIHVVYDRSLDDLPNSHQSLIKSRVIPTSVAFLERALAAKKPVRSIHLNRRCLTPHFFTPSNGIRRRPYCWKDCAPVTTCGHNEIPDSHLVECHYCNEAGTQCGTKGTRGSGFLNTDFVLYVSTVYSDRCKIPDTVAYATYCQLEAETDRPLAGYVNICPNTDPLSDAAHHYTSLLATVKHEILHALGFTTGLFAFYRDDDGLPLTPRLPVGNMPYYNDTIQHYQWSSEIIKTYEKEWRSSEGVFKRKVDYIVTPRVVKEVRQHFDCDTLEGAELENQGGHGTAFTHLEKRIFGNEAMTGTYTHEPAFSRITLALMEDTGWYVANYSSAEDLVWGYKLGCTFVHHSCYQYGLQNEPFCEVTTPAKTSSGSNSSDTWTRCTEPDRAAVALCNLREYNDELPPEYRYFKTLPYFGGTIVLADYCPFLQDFNWRVENVVQRSSMCRLKDNNPLPAHNYNLETYGPDSVCLEHFKHWDMKKCKGAVRHSNHWGSGCYPVKCISSVPILGGETSTNVVLDVYDRTFHCTYPGQKLTVQITVEDTLYTAYLICPDDCRFICSGHVNSRLDGDPHWCYERTSNFVSLDHSTVSLPCKATFSRLSDPFLLVMNVLVIFLLSSSIRV